MAVDVVDAQDVGGAVVALDLDVAVIRPEPLIDGLDDPDPRSAQTKALRHLHAAISDVGVDANLHAIAPPGRGREAAVEGIQAFGRPAANPHVLARMTGLH